MKISNLTIYKKINSKYKLYREYDSISLVDVYENDFNVIGEEIDYRKLRNLLYWDSILSFYNKLKKDSNFDLNLFLNNLSDLIVVKPSFSLIDFLFNTNNLNGGYSPFNNLIVINDDICIYHELLHSASSIINKHREIAFSGFCQINENVYGYGLDEGYTQYLKEKYFGISQEEISIYSFEKLVAFKLEEILSPEIMEKMYSRGDLLGLVKCLEQYFSYEEIVMFIRRIDYVSDNFSNKLYYNNHQLVIKSINDICSFLIKGYCLKNKSFNIDDIFEYCFPFMNVTLYDDNCISCLKKEDINSIYNETKIKLKQKGGNNLWT